MCVVQLITQYSAYFDKVMELFEDIGSVLRPLSDYAEVIYKDNAAVQDALVALYGDLLKFCRLASAIFLKKTGDPRSGLGTFASQLWRPFESQFDDIKGQFRKHLRVVELETTVADRRLIYKETGLQTAYRVDTNAQLRKLALISEERDKEDAVLRRRLLLTWLSSLDFRSSHEKAYGSRHEMTGSWFLRNERFTYWLNAKESALLWCCGKPGAGKSVLTSIVVEHVQSHLPKDQASIAFVYCDSRQQSHSSAILLIGSLLRQLCAKEAKIPDPVSLKYDQVQQQGGESLTWLEMKTLFLQSLPLFRQESVVVFDGLDECDDPAGICDLLNTAVSRHPNNQVKVFVTSRSENRVIKPLLSCYPTISLNVIMVQEDIAAFVRAEVDSLCENGKLRIGNPELKQEIVETLIVKAEGMFLWVRFQMETLCSQTTDGEVRQALGTLPYGLEEVYERALRSVECQPPPVKALARRVIMFVLFSKRSLWAGELLEALAVVPGSKAIDPLHRLNDPSMIVPICAELITVDANNLVQFTHSSIRDFLLNKSNDQQAPTCLTYAVESANVDIGKVCLTYLLYEQVKNQAFQTWDEMQAFFIAHKFIVYASCYWADHARGPGELSLKSLILALLQCEGAAAYRRLWFDLWQTKFVRNDNLLLPAKNPNPLQIIIEEDLSRILKHVPDLQMHLETKDVAGCTPLLTAVVNGQTLLANELLDCGADVKATGPIGVTALHYAARQVQNTDLVSRLIGAGAELLARTDLGRSPVDYAASNSNLACVELLLATLNPELRKVAVSQALCSAADEDCIPVIELLLSNGGDVRYADDVGWSPLHHAVHFQKLNAVKSLLQADADPNFRSGRTCSPLEKAVWKGNMEVVAFLLSAGGDPMLTNEGATLLHWSTMSKNRHVVNWALQIGIDVNQRTTGGRSALMWAAEETTDPLILKELLSAGALVHFKSIKDEVTALDTAAITGSAECVKVLLDAGAHPESKSANGYTSLSWAAANGHSSVVQAILETGAAFDTPDADGKTPLNIAAHLGHNDVVKRLLAVGAALNSIDTKGFTPLHYAVMGKQEAVVQLLLEASAAVDIKDSAGLTPLMIATWPDRRNVFEQLLAKGPGLNTRDDSGFTALSYAASYGHADIVQRLIDKGADLDLPSNSGK